VAMQDSIRLLWDWIGMCERIKRTPFPRHYSFFNRVFVNIFVFLLPIGLVQSLGWLTILFATLIGWILIATEQSGRFTEDPFENFVHDVPMSQLCRKIEIDLRQMLGESRSSLPLPVEPNERGILM
jgi:putative membrane protein